MKVLVTGASGFVASHLVPALCEEGHEVVAASRQARLSYTGALSCAAPALGTNAHWTPLLESVDTVIHLAGRAHITSAHGAAEEDIFLQINADGTRALARQAARAGVRHFIFLSSCHAVAAESGEMLTRATVPKPSSAYGRSKLAAEQTVKEEFQDTGRAWTILRPPLVYGPGNKANFAKLAHAVRAGLPLPVAGITNRRSFLGVSNLCDFILRGCLGNPSAHNRVYYPADEEDWSTPELVGALAFAAGKRPRTFALSPAAARLLARLPGMRLMHTLSASLYVDKSPAREELGWSAPRSARELLSGLF